MQSAGSSFKQKVTEGPWYTHRWPWLVMAGPAAVVVASCFSGWLAFSRQDAMVVDDYYNQGKAINQDLRRDGAATALGVGFAARYDPASEKLVGTLSSYDKPLTGQVMIRLAHATDPGRDRSVAVRPDANGAFNVALPLLERARWNVVVESIPRDWRLTGTWHWPAQSSILLLADLPAAE